MVAHLCRVLNFTKKSYLLTITRTPCIFYSNVSVQNTSFLSENFPSILDRCLNIDSLRKVHACILVHGLENNSYLGSKLLGAYASLDLLTESRWVFNKIIDNNLSLWKSSFACYSKAGFDHEVLRLYLELRRRRGIAIDSSAIIFCLKSCIHSSNFLFGKTVHADTYKFGLNAGCFVGSSLIGLYAKHDRIEAAAKVFDEITEKDVVVYTSMVTGYAQTGDHRSYRAFKMVKDMQRERFEPNRVTLVSLLQAASHSGALKEGKSIHGYAIRKGMGWLDQVFETSLMTMYMRTGPPDKAAVSFSKSSRKTIGSWNALIAGHLQAGYPLEALQLLLQMLQQNYTPDLITLANGLLSCADTGDLAGGKCIHGYIIRNSVQLDLVATTALIDMYSKCKRLILAEAVFDRMDSKKDTGSFNVMMAGYLENGFANLAVEKFLEMIGMGFRPNVSTILNLLSALSNWKDATQVKRVQGFVIRHGFEESTEVANQLIHIYTNCSSSINCARKIFENLENKDIVSWTSIITGYVTRGFAEEAVAFFRKMQVENINPDAVTLVSLLNAFTELGYLSIAREIHCHVHRKYLDEDTSILNSLLTTYSKSGRLIMARNLFHHMPAEQSLATWNSMISAYGMHGDCVEALNLFERMKKEIIPDELTFRSVLSACSHSGFINEGLSVLRSMKEEYQRMPSDEHYGCVIDMLSRAGQLEEAYNLVKCLSSSANTSSAFCSLLAACRVHGNTDMGQMIGRRLLELDPHNPSAINLISNLYAEQENWEMVAKLRGNAKEKSGLKKTVAGHSLIDFLW